MLFRKSQVSAPPRRRLSARILQIPVKLVCFVFFYRFLDI